MKKLKTPKAVTTAVLTLITIFFWAGFEVYRSITIKPTPTVPEAVIKALDPTLDINTLAKLQQRIFLTDDQIGNTQPVASTTPSPTVSPTPLSTSIPISTSSATQTITPSPTP